MYKSNVNLNLYKTFYEVAKCGSISEAAKRTYTSQPAISKAIKKLEDELNTQLFYRTLKGTQLTEKGAELLFFVEESFNNLVIAERHMLETNNLERGKLAIGMPSNIGSFYLFDKLIEFHNKYPNIEITIITGSTRKLLNLLDAHNVDFVIDTSPISIHDDSFVIQKLKTVKYAFIHASNSKLECLDKISSIKDLVNVPLILPIPNTANRLDLDNLFIKNDIEIKNILNVHTSEMIVSFVKRDLGVGYVIEDVVGKELENGELVSLDIVEELPTVDINILYKPTYLTTAPIEFISEYMSEVKLTLE